MKKQKLYLLFFLSFIAFFLGCKSVKHTVVNTDGSVIDKSNEDVVRDILKSELQYQTISGKATLEVIPKNATSGMKTGAYIKLIKDKEFQLSIRIPLINSEAFRVNITPDSIYLIDRVNKKYAIESIKAYQEKHNIDLNFYNLQSVLTNALFIPGKKEVNGEDYNRYLITMANNLFFLETKDKAGTKYSFAVNSKDKIEAIMAYNSVYNFNIEWVYNNFIKDNNNNIYPTDINTNINIKQNQFKLNISYSNLDFNTNIDIDRQIPRKYEKNSIANILRSYIK